MVRAIKKRIIPDGRSPKLVKFTSGVYEILHRPTSQRYVGGSAEVEKRLFWHLSMLRAGKHGSLQAIYDEYGEDELEFFLLEICAPGLTRARELHHQTKESPYTLVGRPVEGYELPSNVKAKLSVSAKRVGADPAERARRSARASGQHASGKFGQATWSEGTKERMRSMPKKTTVFTKEVMTEVLKLRGLGWSQKRIAKGLGLTQTGVSQALRRERAKRKQ